MHSLALVALLPTLISAQSQALVTLSGRSHARDLQKRAEVDCGTFTMYCGGVPQDGGTGTHIESACDNACYFVKVVKGGSYTATYKPSISDDDKKRNRRDSGCNIGSDDHSVCTYMPFSQRFGDGLADPTCDEFPMADWTQPDFASSPKPRNALRCMERGENSAAGSQWENFRDGVGGGLAGRTCNGPMKDPNTDYKFNIAFNTDNAFASSIQYCNSNPDNALDFSEFFMTIRAGDNGLNHFPMTPDNDNHYSIVSGNVNKDLQQCKAVILRQSGDNYSGTIFDLSGSEIGSGEAHLGNDGEYMKIAPPADKSMGMLMVFRTGEMGQAGTVGSRVDFKFRSHEDLTVESPLVDFDWTSESKGRDSRFKGDGSYCDVPNIEENEDGDHQTITCYYPCPKP